MCEAIIEYFSLSLCAHLSIVYFSFKWCSKFLLPITSKTCKCKLRSPRKLLSLGYLLIFCLIFLKLIFPRDSYRHWKLAFIISIIIVMCIIRCWPSRLCGWLGAVAQGPCPASQERIVAHSSAWEKIQTQNSKYGFYWLQMAFAPLWSQKLVSPTTVSQEHLQVGLWCPVLVPFVWLWKGFFRWLFLGCRKHWVLSLAAEGQGMSCSPGER